jgi:hypothetical protein
MQAQAEAPTQFPSHAAKPIPNPRGTQTVAQPKPILPRSPNGRFAPEFHPRPHSLKP